MEKVIVKSAVFVFTVLAAWFLFFQIDWMSIFEVEQNSKKLEEKLGDLYWESIEQRSDIIKNEEIEAGIDSLLTHICRANGIDKSEIKLHVINSSEVNAFTLPDQHMILNSALILSSTSEEELAGVICHELAHIKEKHVMQKLMKEVGLSVLVSMTSGGGGDLIRETTSVLSSSAFDREMEEEADQRAVDYLMEANLNPEGFADFMYRLSQKENDLVERFSWLSTHPLSEDRALYILDYLKQHDFEAKDFMTDEDWDNLQEKVKEVGLED